MAGLHFKKVYSRSCIYSLEPRTGVCSSSHWIDSWLTADNRWVGKNIWIKSIWISEVLARETSQQGHARWWISKECTLKWKNQRTIQEQNRVKCSHSGILAIGSGIFFWHPQKLLHLRLIDHSLQELIDK